MEKKLTNEIIDNNADNETLNDVRASKKIRIFGASTAMRRQMLL